MADAKVTELTALTTPTADDLLVVVDDPGGSPATKKVTVQNFLANAPAVTKTNADTLKDTSRLGATVAGILQRTAQANINAVYVYDTRKDNIDPSWRFDSTKSWYNEAASATRGSRKEFPEVAVLVATNTTLDIYDARDGVLWMQFASAGNFVGTRTLGCVLGLNGRVYVGDISDAFQQGLKVANFVADSMYAYRTVTTYSCINGTISQRNGGVSVSSIPGFPLIVNDKVNAVHAAYLDGQNVVAVATDGGVSVIRERDGTVVNWTGFSGGGTPDAKRSVFLTPSGRVYTQGNWGADSVEIVGRTLPTANLSSGVSDADVYYTASSVPASAPSGNAVFRSLLAVDGRSKVDGKSPCLYITHSLGVTQIDEKLGDYTNGSSRHLDSAKCSELLVGDVRGNWPLAVASVVDGTVIPDISVRGADLVSVAGATKITAAPFGNGLTLNGTSQYLKDRVYHTEANANASWYGAGTVFTDTSATFGITDTDTDLQALYQTASGDSAYILVATDDGAKKAWGYIRDVAKATNNYTLDIGNKRVHSGSGSAQSFIKDAGFNESAATYTWEIRKADFQITGNFSLSIFVKTGTNANGLLTKGNSSFWGLYTSSDGYPAFASGGSAATGSSSVADNAWHQLAGVLNGSTLYLYADGGLVTTAAGAAPSDISDAFVCGVLRGYYFTTGSLAMPLITAEALTAEQIKAMYEAGKAALQAATDNPLSLGAGNYSKLQGSLNAVKGLAVDEVNNCVYVATGGATGGAVTKLSLDAPVTLDLWDATHHNTDDSSAARTSTQFDGGVSAVDGMIVLATTTEFWLQRPDTTLYGHFKDGQVHLSGDKLADLNRLFEPGEFRVEPGKIFRWLRNLTGGALANGDVVVYEYTTYQDGATVTTSTTADDVMVAGVAAEAIPDGNCGWVQVFGTHPAVKIKGDTDATTAGAGVGQSGTAKKAGGGSGLGVALESIAADSTGKVFIRCM